LKLVVAPVTARSRAVQMALEGEPVLVGKDRQIVAHVLKKHHVPEFDLR
jgi:uncharacterized membrane protein YcaP (DUF421 family)